MTPPRDYGRNPFTHGVLWAGPFDGERACFVADQRQYVPATYAKRVADWCSRVEGPGGRPMAPLARYALRPGPELDSTGAMIYDYQGQEI